MSTSPICEVVVAHDVRRRGRLSVRSLLHQYYVRRFASTLFLIVLDVGSIYLAAFLSVPFWGLFGLHDRPHGAVIAPQVPRESELLVAALVAVSVAALTHLYGQREQRSGLKRIITDGIIVLFVLGFIVMFTHKSITTHAMIYIWVLWLILRYLLRTAYDQALVLRFGHTNVRRPALVLGQPELCQVVADSFLQSPAARDVRIVGMVTGDDSQTPASPESGPVRLHRWGTMKELEDVVAQVQPMELIIADPDLVRDRMLPILELCRRERLTLRMAARNIELRGQSVSFAPGFDMPVFLVTSPSHSGADYVAKRALDIIVSALALIILSPLFALIALAIRLTSRGPVFFLSSRVGLGQRPFTLIKFRTMHKDANALQQELEEMNEADGAIFKIRDDPRVTQVGRVLRRTGLDELPQLINVLRGQMSLVGPRPLPIRDNHLLEDWHKRRHVVLPGLTGPWQISGRSRLSFEKMIELDFGYIDTWSFRTDLKIIARTIWFLLGGRSGY
jgi:exopolysaccharide biosynthesis polyprenyl glycosylphosphotransferase